MVVIDLKGRKMNNFLQEQKEKLRQEMIMEQRLRDDYDFAFEYVSNKYNLYDKVASIRSAVQELHLLGYEVNECEIVKEI